MNPAENNPPVFSARNLSKRFGEIPILSDVHLDIRRTQVIGIVGENGAGKTTLFNILSGLLAPNEGQMTLRGRPYQPRSYREANGQGVFRVFQEQALIPNIRVYENLLLSLEERYTRFGQFVNKGAMIDAAQHVIDQAELEIDVRRVTDSYSFSKRQLIEIARACLVPTEILGMEDPIVLLDEPTSALERGDESTFRELVRRLRKRASIVLVSHRLSEVLELCDVVYVLKDGSVVECRDAEELDEKTLHGLMVGREREADYYHERRQRDHALPDTVFNVAGLSGPGYRDVTLSVRAGEIVGIGGLMNSGKSEFGKGAAGIVGASEGIVQLAGGEPMAPDLRRLTRLGLGYVPAERLREGMISEFPVKWNLSLAGGMDRFSNAVAIWRRGDETAVTREYMNAMPIKAESPEAACSSLSGGNQQKVVLARWLCRDPVFLVLDNPTRGVDAGAKEEIYRLLRDLCDRGVGILLITDDLLELIGLSNRVVVMQNGRITGEIHSPANDKPSERKIVRAMLTAANDVTAQRDTQPLAGGAVA